MDTIMRGSRRARRLAGNAGNAADDQGSSPDGSPRPPGRMGDMGFGPSRLRAVDQFPTNEGPEVDSGEEEGPDHELGNERPLHEMGYSSSPEPVDGEMQIAPDMPDGEAYEAESTSMEDNDAENEDPHEEEHEGEHEEEQEQALPFDPSAVGLKEISNLGKFTVSSHKQGNGVNELRNDDVKLYWQSDGPQPHKLTVYWIKRVGIRDIRFYVDFNDDESYTPTKIVFKSGTSENNLIEFATMELTNPVGWQQVPVAGAGGGPDGNTLVSYVLQMQILENHQNGKDTHLRGIKIYAFDGEGEAARAERDPIDQVADMLDGIIGYGSDGVDTGRREGGLSIPDFMLDPELR